MSHNKRLMSGILGGTFDPIHNGHLRAGLEILQMLQLDEVRFIPCHQSAFKEETIACAHDRLNMIFAAIESVPAFKVDDREIKHGGKSYTIDTLKALRQEHPDTIFNLLLGSDAFINLDGWKHWEKLLDYCHIIIMLRPGKVFNPTMDVKRFFDIHQASDLSDLRENLHGFIYLQDITQLDISATAIRAQLQAGYSPEFLLPESVLKYILEKKLYV